MASAPTRSGEAVRGVDRPRIRLRRISPAGIAPRASGSGYADLNPGRWRDEAHTLASEDPRLGRSRTRIRGARRNGSRVPRQTLSAAARSSEEPTPTPDEGVKGETDVPTAPPTDTLVSSSTTQTGGALPILLIVLGFISLGAVVVTPARNRR